MKTLPNISDTPVHLVHAHEQDSTHHEHVLIGEHAERAESDEFRKNKAFLVQQHPGCWLATDLCTTKVECHHVTEWSAWPSIDPARLQTLLTVFDPYGFSAFYRDRAMTTPDDIRNLILLCDRHHRGKGLGAHDLTWPTFWAIKARKAGVSVTAEEAALRGQP